MQLHLLAPLAGTPLTRAYAHRLQPVEQYSDLSAPDLATPEECALVLRHPDVFSSFYAIPCPIPRERAAHVRMFMLCVIDRLRWLVCALTGAGVDWLDLFERWREHCASRGLTRIVITTRAATSPTTSSSSWRPSPILPIGNRFGRFCGWRGKSPSFPARWHSDRPSVTGRLHCRD